MDSERSGLELGIASVVHFGAGKPKKRNVLRNRKEDGVSNVSDLKSKNGTLCQSVYKRGGAYIYIKKRISKPTNAVKEKKTLGACS